MILGASAVSVLAALFSNELSAQAPAAPLPRRPDWVIGAALAVLMLIFGAVVCAYLGVFKRKSSRSYGWWW